MKTVLVSVRVISTVLNAAQIATTIIMVLYPVVSLSSLTLGVNECFERVSIGRRLNGSDVSRSVNNTTLKQCDVECERELCNAYSYGIGPNGNGTCELSVSLPRSPPNEDPDYDLFLRILQCRDMTMCFKRLVAGRRIVDRYVRRTFPCDSLARCQLACSVEREFICEGFNYRFASTTDIGNSCQLSAIPGMNLDLTLDFTSDIDYDYYSRDRNAPPTCGLLTYATWNYGGYNRRTYAPTDDWGWQKPTTALPLDPAVNFALPPPPPLPQSTPSPTPIDYDDIYRNRWNSPGYECFVRARTGYRLHRQIVVMTLNAATLYDCENICANKRKFKCNILSYRYSTVPTADNCLLGEKTIGQMDFYFDLTPDRNYDVYVRNEYARAGCQPKKTWDTDCFERIRTGLRLDTSMVRFSVNTDTLVDCELVCLHVKHFTCRAFSFRYGISSNGYNCLLTDIPATEMDPRRHFIEDSGCELYHRGSYGHGCEINRWPYSANPTNYPNFMPPLAGKGSLRAPILPSTSPPSQSTVVTVTGPTVPTSSTYDSTYSIFGPKISRPYLPPPPPPPLEPKFRPQKPILPPWNTSPIVNPRLGHNVTYQLRKHDKTCYIAYGAPARLKATAVAKTVLVVNEQECKAECNRNREMTKFRCATISYWSGHCELSDVELRDLKLDYDFVRDDSYWLFSWDFTNPQCYKPNVTPPTDGVWAAYTVTGRRCKWGVKCSHRSDVGIWSCPVDEGGDWDYCCRPDHHCGYSEGYSYPWCYVGSVSREQWRPCNDLYFPYNEQRKDAPHWPISYVHRRGPPNGTAMPYQFKPSIVDSFFDSLRSDKERVINAKEPMLRSYSNDNSSVIEFQVVDVTEMTGVNPNASSITNDHSNVTTNNQLSIFSSTKKDK